MPNPFRVCFVCSGNICRSPTAEVVLNRLAAQAELGDVIRADSAGTGSWHVGENMDERSRRVLAGAGYSVPRHVAKQFTPAHFAVRDLVVALDAGHRDALYALAERTPDPRVARAKIVLLRHYDPLLPDGVVPDVADPYYGGQRGFAEVLEQVERSCAGLLDVLARAVGAAVQPAQQTDSPPR